MKVKLRRGGVIIAELRVHRDGAMSIHVRDAREIRDIKMSVEDSRRVAGAIVEKSVQHTVRVAKRAVASKLLDAIDEPHGGRHAQEEDDE